METPTPDRFPPEPSREPVRQPRAAGPRRRTRKPRTTPRTTPSPGRRAAHAAARPARALADTFRYWRAERTTLRHGMVSLSISALGNIPTGLALGAMTGRLEALPGLFILIPAAIGMRGAIFGALGSRLGTALHAGLLRFTWEPEGRLRQNIYASTLLTFASSFFIALAARALAVVAGFASIGVLDYVVISVVGGLLSSAFILAVTIWLAYVGSKRGWDLDSVAAPLITFVGDLITLPALFLASFIAEQGNVTTVFGVALAAISVWAFVAGIRSGLPITRRIVRESALTLALAGVVALIAGVVIEQRIDRFLAFPALFVMLPPFLENAGALGGIVSSRLASKLHLGSIAPRLLPERLAWLEISLAGPWALLNFAATGLAAHYVALALGPTLGGNPSPGALRMTLIAMIAGAIATIGAAVVAYGTAVATFRFDLDPDNHGIAAVTSSMDLVGVVAIVLTVSALGVS